MWIVVNRRLWTFLAWCGVLVLGGAAGTAYRPVRAQNVPPQVQQELQRRGMTVEQAQREAERLGIDLSDPEEATRQAREMGIPESIIEQMLAAVEGVETDSMLSDPAFIDREVPVLAGRPVITPDRIIFPASTPFFSREQRREAQQDRQLSEEEMDDRVFVDSLIVRVPLRDELSGIAAVDLYLLDPSFEDTLYASKVWRVLGSRYEGTWQGQFYIPIDVPPGRWTLYARVQDEQGNDNIIETEEELRLERFGEPLEEEEDTVGVSELSKYFGYETFAQMPESFQPSGTAPVGDSYLVGPGDQLRLILFGATEFQYDLAVDNEGRIFVPQVGQRTVAGTRLDQLREDLRTWLARSYAGLLTEPPEVMMDLTVTRLRPANVYVLGEVDKPGGHILPTNSTVFNALYAVGGPRTSGSLRDIRVVRGGELVSVVDIYEYLLNGFAVGDIRLSSGDNVFIPPRGLTVEVRGAVRRPAIYELRQGETFQDLLHFAGGLRAEAYARRFQVERIVPFSERTDPSVVRSVQDYELGPVLAGNRSVPLVDGDIVTIFEIPGQDNLATRRTVRAVSVSGAVLSPGRYELTDSLRTVSDLIGEADGLTGDAFSGKIELIRLTDDLEREILSLNLTQVLEDIPTQNLVLQAQDSVHVYSMQTLEEQSFVEISGQVRTPGTYELYENMTVMDLLFKGGGLSDSEYLKDVFLERADLFRQRPDGRGEEIISFHLGEALSGEGFASERLLPEDEIRIYPVEVEVLRERVVEISGAVKQPGSFRYRDGMTLEDLILQAGGFQEGAYLEEVEVTRLDLQRISGELATSLQVPLVQGDRRTGVSFALNDTTQALSAARRFELVHRDRVYVRMDPGFKDQQTVTVSGEVQFPGTYTLLRENESLSDLIRRAGGVLPTAYPKGGRLLREDLQVIIEIDRAIEGRQDANIVMLPGDEVVIPPQPNTVAVRGNVANEGLIKYEPGRRLSYYLDRAGGKRPDTESILLTQASGATFRVKTGMFRLTPVVDEGATIFVTRKPPKPPGEGIDLGRTIVDSLALISSTLTILVLARQAFN